MEYLIVIHKDPESVYGVSVPDLPGCFSAGETLAEAMTAAQEAIIGHIDTLLMAGRPIPDQLPFEEHLADEHYRDGVWALVNIDISKISGKAVRINITVPQRVLNIVDLAASQSGESRSGFLTRAALHVIQQERQRESGDE